MVLLVVIQMEPHDETTGGFVVNHLGALKNTPTLDIVPGLIRHGECHAFISPVYKILRRITRHTNHRR